MYFNQINSAMVSIRGFVLLKKYLTAIKLLNMLCLLVCLVCGFEIVLQINVYNIVIHLQLLGLVYVLDICIAEFQWILVETMNKRNACGTKLRVTFTS